MTFLSRAYRRIDRLRKKVGRFAAHTGEKLKMKSEIMEGKRGSGALDLWQAELRKRGFRQVREQYWLLAYPKIVEVVGEPEIAFILTALVGRFGAVVIKAGIARMKGLWVGSVLLFRKRRARRVSRRVTVLRVLVRRRSNENIHAMDHGETMEQRSVRKRVIILILEKSNDRPVS